MPSDDIMNPELRDAPQNGRPTLKTIAYMTGLGVTTVSRALSDAPDIAESTKERVRLVAKQIGYRPNRAGVRLRTGKTNVISLVLNLEREVFGVTAQLVYGISEKLANTPYHLIITPYRFGIDPLDAVKYVVETASADGLILSRTEPNDPRVRYLTDRGFPFATHGRTDMGIEHPYSDFDNLAYGKLAIDRLVELGRGKICLLAPPANLMYGQHMAAGFQQGIEQHDLIEVPLRRVTVDSTTNDITEAICQMMQRAHRPDGLICGSAQAAIAATAGIEKAGYALGKDIDIVVKESFDIMAQFRPEIQVVKEDFMSAGLNLAQAVIETINGAPASQLQHLQMPQLDPR